MKSVRRNNAYRRGWAIFERSFFSGDWKQYLSVKRTTYFVQRTRCVPYRRRWVDALSNQWDDSDSSEKQSVGEKDDKLDSLLDQPRSAEFQAKMSQW